MSAQRYPLRRNQKCKAHLFIDHQARFELVAVGQVRSQTPLPHTLQMQMVFRRG